MNILNTYAHRALRWFVGALGLMVVLLGLSAVALAGHGSGVAPPPVALDGVGSNADTLSSHLRFMDETLDGSTINVQSGHLPPQFPRAVGGMMPYTYAFTNQDDTPLMTGFGALNINVVQSTGDVRGAADTPGTYMVRFSVTDSASSPATANLDFTIVVTSEPSRPGDGAPLAGADAGNAAVLPELARLIGGGSMGAIAGRVAQVQLNPGARSVPDADSSLNIGGNRDWRNVLANSSFALPLNGDGGGARVIDRVSFWGGGDYRSVSADANGGLPSVDGNVFSLYFGADIDLREWRDDMVGGVMLARNDVSFDYDNSGGHDATITTISPYLGWLIDGGGGWASIGFGSGDVSLRGGGSTDTDLQHLGIGGHRELQQNLIDKLPSAIQDFFADWQLRIKAEAQSTTIKTAAGGGLIGQSASAQMLRALLNAADSDTVKQGTVRRDYDFQLGLRYDAGDGATGIGIESGAKVAFHNDTNGITTEGGAHLLLGKSGYQEYGLYGLVRRAPRGGQGLSLTLRPGYGSTTTTANIWESIPTTPNTLSATLNATIGYAITTPTGTITPYTESHLAPSSQTHRLGLKWKHGSRLELNLTGEHHKTTTGTPTNLVLLRGVVRL